MNARYEFEGAEVKRLIEESKAAKVRLMTEAQRYLASGIDLHADDADASAEPDHPGTGAPPGLWLMNDRGVYLRSNAKTRDRDRVSYARGYRGEVQMGPEAFCEFIDASPLEQLQSTDTLVITLSEQKIRLSLTRAS